MSEPSWLARDVILAIHERQIVEHGGAPGLRDAAALDSALARARNLQAYGDPDPYDLAAAYAYGIARDHPFVDGNKRVAFVAARVFLLLRGLALTAPKAESAATFVRLAAGEISEPELAARLRRNTAAS
ncbi:MAG: type II toxin-antitoxin system death-on-curing family toxin [Dongiaceae bacterium]